MPRFTGFSPAFLDEVRSRLSPSQVIGRRVNLKSKGRGEFTGLCCFHNEKTPSFTVSDDKGFYHCFGCGAHGDIIKFVMETQGFSFAETVKALAEEAGLEVPKFTKDDEERYRRIESAYEVLELAAKCYEENLRLKAGSGAISYLKERGISEESIKKFRLGFALDGKDALKNTLISKGCNEQQLLETGLIAKSENGQTYDRFRGRVIFPITDIRGRIIAFGGRILGDGQPKYLNSADSDLFHKGHVLYGMNLARERAYEKGNIAVVEGYMDVIAMHQAGITNTVAPLGTAVTENHLLYLWKLAKEPVICLDGDNAGKRAMARLAELSLPFLKPGYSLKFAILPEGEDPDEVIKNYGKGKVREILGSAMPLSDALWEIALGGMQMKTPEQKAEFEARIMGIVEKIKDNTVKDYYRNHYKNLLWEKKRGKKFEQKAITSGELKGTVIRFKGERDKLEANLITTIINHPDMLYDADIEEEFTRIEVADSLLDKIRHTIMDFLGENESEITRENLYEHLEKLGFGAHISKLNSDVFIDYFAKPSAPSKVARNGWDYFLTCYNFHMMEEEYKKAVENVTDETSEMVWELKKQKDVLKKLVEKEKMSYEAALEE